MSHKFGYARVSTSEQHLNNQIDYLKAQGVSEDNIYTDEISGVLPYDERGGFTRLLRDIGKGDTLVIFRLDRLSRDIKQLKELIQLLHERGIKLQSGDIPNIDTGNHAMDGLMFDLIVSVLSFMAESERVYMKDRQKLGIERAKERGVYKGRERKYSKHSRDKQGRIIYERIVELLQNGETIRGTAKKVNVSQGTVQRIKNELNEEVTKL